MAEKSSICKTTIAPCFDYQLCVAIAFDGRNIFRETTTLQNRAMRSVLGCNKLTLESLDWLNVKQRMQATTLTFSANFRHLILLNLMQDFCFQYFTKNQITINKLGVLHTFSMLQKINFHIYGTKPHRLNNCFESVVIMFQCQQRSITAVIYLGLHTYLRKIRIPSMYRQQVSVYRQKAMNICIFQIYKV